MRVLLSVMLTVLDAVKGVHWNQEYQNWQPQYRVKVEQNYVKTIINNFINDLPYELHIPGYQFCGPGTKFDERVRRGELGINKLDKACMYHDKAYNSRDFIVRNAADLVLLETAKERLQASDASRKEKFAARIIIRAMEKKFKAEGVDKFLSVLKLMHAYAKKSRSNQLVESLAKELCRNKKGIRNVFLLRDSDAIYILNQRLPFNKEVNYLEIPKLDEKLYARVINEYINTLPYELHLPGYQFCGPGTNLEKRLDRGDRGINKLDEACMYHDIAYNNKDLRVRHAADLVLLDAAKKREKSIDAGVREKIASWIVKVALEAKLKAGGVNEILSIVKEIHSHVKQMESKDKQKGKYGNEKRFKSNNEVRLPEWLTIIKNEMRPYKNLPEYSNKIKRPAKIYGIQIYDT